MYFLFSGEGATDLGLCKTGAHECKADAYNHGPMTIIVDQIVEENHGYSFLEGEHYGYVSKRVLVERARVFKARKKSPRLPGKKKAKETANFYRNARALALCAKDKEAKLEDEVVAVLFRDSDGTASAGRGLWPDKRKSMMDGFEEEGFSKGVPMIPKPKSEAWVLCAVKKHYEGCKALEDRSGNDDSPDSLKKELEEHIGSLPSSQELCEMVTNRTIDIQRIDMPSFKAFQRRLKEVIYTQRGQELRFSD